MQVWVKKKWYSQISWFHNINIKMCKIAIFDPAKVLNQELSRPRGFVQCRGQRHIAKYCQVLGALTPTSGPMVGANVFHKMPWWRFSTVFLEPEKWGDLTDFRQGVSVSGHKKGLPRSKWKFPENRGYLKWIVFKGKSHENWWFRANP